jgi:predicted metal-binding membrane protein
MILMDTTINRRRREQQQPYVPTTVFLGGYLLIWSGFSVLATLVQWGLHSAALLSPMMRSTSPLVGGLVLLAAGSFQWTPLKYTCLMHCRSPLGFLMTDWREGSGGALIMGVRHGMYCVGCCWISWPCFCGRRDELVMGRAIAGFVLVEKVVPVGSWSDVWQGLDLSRGLVMMGQAPAKGLDHLDGADVPSSPQRPTERASGAGTAFPVMEVRVRPVAPAVCASSTLSG